MTHNIAVIAGDGIGKEVIPAGIAALERAARGSGVSLTFTDLPWGCDYYLRQGRMMDADGFERLATFDAIYLGAIGDPKVPDHIAVWDLLLPLRQRFQQYVNLRPMRLLPGLTSPLANRRPADIDMVCVRENSEGEYSGLGGRIHVGTRFEAAEQTGLFTRTGIERILRYGFEVASRRPRKLLASATKSNALRHSMVFWDEVAEIVRTDYPAVEYRKYHVDAIAARMVTNPASLDVIVCSNLFGDILTDIGSAISGSLGIAPGANINPERTAPSMFEPIHGSAPDIAGKGIANPIGQIWSGAMMLEHLGHKEAAAAIVKAIEKLFADTDVRTADMGGKATCRELGDAIAQLVRRG
ncbi:MAG: tartrate dehydrogenase [Alphaproteobacteria bacterium]|nr:MAG: tartrate dehydrogenase [Alphaproteobacteria bacterium]